VVGRETALQDNPSLRWSLVASQNPKRVIVDSTGRISPKAKVFTDGHVQNTIIATTRGCSEQRVAAYRACGAQVWQCGRGARVSLKLLMRQLGKVGVLHVLCEGGGELAFQLVREDQVDVYEFFVAPSLLGGGGTPVIGGAGWGLSQAPQLRFIASERVGNDIWIRAVPKRHQL